MSFTETERKSLLLSLKRKIFDWRNRSSYKKVQNLQDEGDQFSALIALFTFVCISFIVLATSWFFLHSLGLGWGEKLLYEKCESNTAFYTSLAHIFVDWMFFRYWRVPGWKSHVPLHSDLSEHCWGLWLRVPQRLPIPGCRPPMSGYDICWACSFNLL